MDHSAGRNTATEATPSPPQPQTVWDKLRQLDRRHAVWVVMAVAALLYSKSQFLKQPALGDRANWDYFAQVIARGGVPYRDVVNIKSPLSAYIGAAAIVATRPFGLREIYATRAAYVLLTALTIALTFLVATLYFDCRRIGILAALIL